MAHFNSTLSKPRALFIDLSGTIHIDDNAIPNSIAALKKLKDHKIPHIFVTNTSKVNCGIQSFLPVKKKDYVVTRLTKQDFHKLDFYVYRNLNFDYQKDF